MCNTDSVRRFFAECIYTSSYIFDHIHVLSSFIPAVGVAFNEESIVHPEILKFLLREEEEEEEDDLVRKMALVRMGLEVSRLGWARVCSCYGHDNCVTYTCTS